MKKDEQFWKKWNSKIDIDNGYAIIMCTDRFIIAEYPMGEVESELDEIWENRLLDIRVFNSEKEYRLFRGDVGRGFSERILDDRAGDYFDDEQYLDIDTKRSKKTFMEQKKVRATGGGFYMLPLDDYQDIKLKIRNYLGYDERGHAYVKAVRLIGFEKEGNNGKR